MGDVVAGCMRRDDGGRSADAVIRDHDGRGGHGRHPRRRARHRPGHPLFRQRQFRRHPGGRLRSAALLPEAPSRRRAGEGRGRIARTAPAPADLRLLPAGARGRAFHALGRGWRGSAHQGHALPGPGQGATRWRIHFADVRAQPWRHRGPDPVAMRRVRRGLHAAGHGHGVRFLRYPRQHRLTRCRCRPASKPPATARGHAGRRIP